MRGKRVFIGLRALAIFAVSLLVTSSWAATNWNEKVLYNFGNGADGKYPASGLIRDAAGNLYGTTVGGPHPPSGTVFELSPTQGGGWTETVLYTFGGLPDGAEPWAGLIFDAAGNLYGTTSQGGNYLYGTVFELMPNGSGGWTETVLHSFGSGTDGYQPLNGSLMFDAAGNLYGTTQEGGTAGGGTVFELTPNGSGGWTETVLHSFGSGTDGRFPLAGLIFDAAGDLYGTTELGGNSNAGTVFELTPNGGGGWTETVLHRFGNGTDGAEPWAGLIFDARGNLYGTTFQGGNYLGGTVFELTPNGSGGWAETVLHSFGKGTDGYQPTYGSLIFDAAGNLYGTTQLGGSSNSGTVFELTPDGSGGWAETLLDSFDATDGQRFPWAGLIFDAAGNLYGTTYGGGTYGHGTVFELTPIHPCIRCSHAGLR
jgi:uncharacterized repeat protein (TIGR03803 family)